MTAPLYPLVRRGSGGKPPLVALLHGYGSNAEDLFQLEGAFDERFTVVSFQAPAAVGRGQYAWFPLEFSSEGPVPLDIGQAFESRRLIAEAVRWCHAELGTDPDRTVLAGFSQGAILGSGVVLAEPELILGAALMSGRLLPEFIPQNWTSAARPSFVIVHGLYDQVLPIRHGREARQTLTALGFEPEYREFPMQHQISDESLETVLEWLDRTVPV